MSIRFEYANSERLTRSTGALLQCNVPYTIMGWCKLASDIDSWGHFFAIFAPEGYDHVGHSDDGVTLRWEVNEVAVASNIALTVGQWYHIAMVRYSDTNLTVYLNGSQVDEAANTNISSRTASNYMSVSAWGDEWTSNSIMSAIKMWQRGLSQQQVYNEMRCVSPYDRKDLWGFYPCPPGTDRAKDYSGYGHHFTESGTLSDESPPPVPWSIVKPAHLIFPVPQGYRTVVRPGG